MEPRRPSLCFVPALLFSGALSACGREAPAPAVPAAHAEAPSSAPPSSAVAASPQPSATSPKPTFENPGGMWMPEQLAAQGKILATLGLEIDPAALSTPTSDVLQSVVSLGGCSASFVSPDGLLATNHHCSTGALQFNATPKDNLLKIGFLAKTREEEKWNGPTSKVFVTESFRDVTKEIRDGVEKIRDDGARFKKIEERSKALVAACEKGRPGTRCSVAEFFGGAMYRLVEQLEIRDVRLVFAPHEGVGSFGGEIDNWRWPRHSGDVALFRAYVGKDGRPADFAADNVPYKPPHHLRLASKPLKPGDLVVVAGYPGKTNRLKTAGEIDEAVSWFYPRAVKFMEENIVVLEKVAAASDELKIKVSPTTRGLHNGLTKYRGILDGLVGGGLAAEKVKEEERLTAWVAADAGRRAAYGDVLDKMEKLAANHRKNREASASLGEIYRMASLIASAGTIVRMAEERPKADAARHPAFQERNWARIEASERSGQKRYDRAIDRAVLKLALQRAARLPAKERPAFLSIIVGAGEATDARIDAAIDRLYGATKLEDLEGRIALLKSAKLEALKKSTDPVVQLALKLRPLQKAMEEREESYAGAMAIVRPRFVEMLEKSTSTPLAPDANSTLRITYGTVRGYKPAKEAEAFRPFTVVSEMVKKSTGTEPFSAPEAVLGALRAKKFGAYVDGDLGEIPVDFLSDVDITGGNSGSATLNGRGELVGLAFDGNYESMASDWLFMPTITRTIHVDARYVLWLLDAVYGGDHLVKEMGGTPSVQ